MAFLLVPAAVFTLVTFVLATLWRGALALRHRPAPGFWARTFKWHGGLFLLHLFVTVPLALALLFTSFVGTRGDEAAYSGPRIAEDGHWILQTRESLAAERSGKVFVPAAVRDAAAARAVSLSARDGVKLRGFLVPPAEKPGEDRPRFVAVLAHGLFRGALEIETPGSMLRDLGGEVLLLELRNHGGSGHARRTYGRDEPLDVVAAVDFLRARPEARGRPLVLYAVSLGTAAAATAAPLIPGLAGLVLDAPMDDLASTAHRMLGGGGFWASIRDPWASTMLFFVRHVRGVPIDEVHPGRDLARLAPSVAVLIVGAGRDARMPPDEVRALYESLPTAPGRKDLWIDPEATHGKVWVEDPEQYRRRLAHLCEIAIEGASPAPPEAVGE